MQKFFLLFAWLCFVSVAMAQSPVRDSIRKNIFTDSLKALAFSDDMLYDLPMVTVDGQDHFFQAIISPPLSSGRDPVTGMLATHLTNVRFRLRGYEAAYTETAVNGISMNSAEDGNTQWGLWSGLTDVSSNMESYTGLRLQEWGFGGIGNNTSIDMRASRQRVRNQLSYGFSNKNFSHRLMYTCSGSMNKKGWFYSFSGTGRSGGGYIAGTGLQGISYYLGIDHRISKDHLLSFIFFESMSESGKQGAITGEMIHLTGSAYYNPDWGYQSGKKRNANIAGSHQPVVIITDERKIGEKTVLINSIGCIAGNKTNSMLDWYRAADPRPDYYKYLPSYQTNDFMKQQLADAWGSDEGVRQINWSHLYEVNRKNNETIIDADGVTGNNVRGLLSHYILSQRVTGNIQIKLGSRFQTELNAVHTLAGGWGFALQQTQNYKRVNDLLGGDFFVDRNQFAANDFPADPDAVQNDLNRPNRVLRMGDRYGYDYEVVTQKAEGWMQWMFNTRKLDAFAAVDISYTNYQRTGNIRNGLFPDNSFGKSTPSEFINPAVKAGMVYKINGRKYVYLGLALMSKAPAFRDLYISPGIRDTKQENISSEYIKTAEAGYVWNAPLIKLRATGYVTGFLHGMKVTTFYHDGYGSLVNYAITGIDRLHFGMEIGFELKLSSRFHLNAAASSGRYYYNNRQEVVVSSDNDAAVLERTIIYSKNFRIAGTPQDAIVAGIRYQSTKGFYWAITGSYYKRLWIDFNPLRRTYAAMQNVLPGTEQWNKLIAQTQLAPQCFIDFSLGSTMRTRLFQKKQKKIIAFNLSINNLLNNRQMISGGFEQLRFDTETSNPDKFPPKLLYAMGFNFSTNISLRL